MPGQQYQPNKMQTNVNETENARKAIGKYFSFQFFFYRFESVGMKKNKEDAEEEDNFRK